jgi:hypothetical protein
LNQNLVDDLSCTFDELDALKRTVVESHSLVIAVENKHASKQRSAATDTEADETMLVVPSFLRVMQAEQILEDNFIYEETDSVIAANL